MAAAAVRTTGAIPVPRFPAAGPPRTSRPESPSRHPVGRGAVAYQRVLHQLVRREWRLLGELATWAPAGEAERVATLTRHADLIGRVLLHHHAVEREAVWPALVLAAPEDRSIAIHAALVGWIGRCAPVDHLLRNVLTAARQWQVARSAPARDVFARGCLELADAVDAQTADEEAVLLPLLAAHLGPGDWVTIARSSHSRLSAREQLVVLGLALEDSSRADRARLLSGLTPATRLAWRTNGRRMYRSAVVRLRGAPPAE